MEEEEEMEEGEEEEEEEAGRKWLSKERKVAEKWTGKGKVMEGVDEEDITITIREEEENGE